MARVKGLWSKLFMVLLTLVFKAQDSWSASQYTTHDCKWIAATSTSQCGLKCGQTFGYGSFEYHASAGGCFCLSQAKDLCGCNKGYFGGISVLEAGCTISGSVVTNGTGVCNTPTCTACSSISTSCGVSASSATTSGERARSSAECILPSGTGSDSYGSYSWAQVTGG